MWVRGSIWNYIQTGVKEEDATNEDPLGGRRFG